MLRLLALAFVLLLPTLAWADPSAGGSTAQNMSLWIMFAVMLCSFGSYLARRLSSTQGGFFHTPIGATVLAVLSAAASAIAPAIQAQGLSWGVVAAAAMGAVMSVISTSNPSVPTGVPAPMAKPPAAVLVLILAGLVGLNGCIPLSQCKTPAPAQVAKCQLEQNLIACGEKDGLALVPVILNIIMSLAISSFDPSTLLADLESQGFSDAPCVLAAIEDYMLPVAPAIAGKVHDTLKLAVVKRGAHGLVQIKLRSGKVVSVVVP